LVVPVNPTDAELNNLELEAIAGVDGKKDRVQVRTHPAGIIWIDKNDIEE
jgi:pectate lyase